MEILNQLVAVIVSYLYIVLPGAIRRVLSRISMWHLTPVNIFPYDAILVHVRGEWQ